MIKKEIRVGERIKGKMERKCVRKGRYKEKRGK
jgi:hypothetical protein